MHRRDRAPR